ncbi:hypothetical protein M6B38_409475 [Iris pallida]|uniref:Uncharacterized protein n=1 Tax=Iris pallida TaxID=29817 RepID=A0AAX6FNC6_IRIPA|nr:hypothetical protein M6B38_409475 [Iris pallida]
MTVLLHQRQQRCRGKFTPAISLTICDFILTAARQISVHTMDFSDVDVLPPSRSH